MINWKDRKYINPRKRVFKNMDTNEILNFEIQDDLDNIEEESTTPLNAHNLNMAQQDLLDDMSKTYKGTSITAPTVEGYGRINKVYGHTVEEGTGEKSPSNPYTLKCVGDLINIPNTQLENSGIISENGNNYENEPKRLRTIGYITLEAGNYTVSVNSIKQTRIAVFKYGLQNDYIGNIDKNIFNNSLNFALMEKSKVRFVFAFSDNSNMLPTNITNIQIQKNIEIISQNGDQQSSNVVVTKPLCCLKDGDNIVAQDCIDYSRGVVHRECGYVVLDGNTNISYMDTSNNTARFMVALDNVKSITTYKCDKLKVLKQSEAGDEECVIIRDLSSDNIVNIRVKRDRLSEVSTAGIKNYLSSNPITLIYQLATPTTEPLNCSNKIVQYADETTVSNRDGAEIEVSLTNNKAISEVNEDIGELRNDVNKMNEYSTEEQRVGTWIDGKPIYRKVLQTTLNGTYKEGDYTYTWFTFDSSSSMVVNIRIYIFDNNKTYFNDNPAINYLIENNKTLRVGIKSSIPANSSMTIIVEYTKTTD